MAPRINYGQAEEAVKGQDCILAAPESRVFGVFDGLGGYAGGDVAARTAARAVRDYYQARSQPAEPGAIAAALQTADTAVTKEQQRQRGLSGMATTATVIHVFEQDGRPCLAYAHAGDTRLYRSRGKTLDLITEDEGSGNRLLQALGTLRAIKQSGTVALRSGDRLLLCSDGITGDWLADQLLDSEIRQALAPEHTPQAAADTLLRTSRKHDDKSALVVAID